MGCVQRREWASEESEEARSRDGENDDEGLS